MQAQYETKLIYRKLDENGDYVWGNSMNDMLSEQAAMSQVIQTRLRAIQGEWWEGDRTALSLIQVFRNISASQKETGAAGPWCPSPLSTAAPTLSSSTGP